MRASLSCHSDSLEPQVSVVLLLLTWAALCELLPQNWNDSDEWWRVSNSLENGELSLKWKTKGVNQVLGATFLKRCFSFSSIFPAAYCSKVLQSETVWTCEQLLCSSFLLSLIWLLLSTGYYFTTLVYQLSNTSAASRKDRWIGWSVPNPYIQICIIGFIVFLIMKSASLPKSAQITKWRKTTNIEWHILPSILGSGRLGLQYSFGRIS